MCSHVCSVCYWLIDDAMLMWIFSCCVETLRIQLQVLFVIANSKRDGTRAETRFCLLAKRTSPFKSAGMSVQSTTGSRGVRISWQRLYRPCSDVQCKASGYQLHSHLSPSLSLPCVTVCHQVPNVLYNFRFLFVRHLLTAWRFTNIYKNCCNLCI